MSAALLAPAGASAAQASPLSPRLVVLSSPQVRALGAAKQAKRVGLTPSGAGSLLRHGRRLVVAVRFDEGALARTEALKEAGAQVINGSRRYQTDTVAVLPSQLRKLAAVPGVEGVQEEITPITRAVADCPQGSVVSEGDSQLEANRARELFGVDGSGVTVGVISDSFNQWYKGRSEAEDVASGDLPGPTNPCGFNRAVKVVTPFIPGAYPEPGEEPENPPSEEEESGEGSDEGRGMAQIVHDIAPGANMDFASAFNGELAFAKAIRDLKAEGAQIIGDDISYFDEPFYQDGPIAQAVNEVTAQGVNYFSAAGNDNLQNAEGENIGSFETPEYEGIECPAAIPSYYGSCENFSPEAAEGEEDNTFGITLEEEWPLFLDLQWGQPWNGVTTDFDMFLIREGGEVVPAFNEPNTEPGRQEPYEMIPWEAHEEEGEPEEEVQVVIARCDEACGEERAEMEEPPGVKPYEGTKGGDDGTPRLKLAIVNNGGGVPEVEYPPVAYEEAESEDVVGPTIYGHTAAASAISVAAINVRTKEKPEYYSSRGPVLHLFGPVTGTGAAAPIGEQTIAKPNVTASDCGATTAFFEPAFEGRYYFCGTSAATPHAAGVAALIRSANPGATSAQVRAVLESTAVPIGPLGGRYGPSAVGAGLIDAKDAVALLALPPVVTITNSPAPVGKVKQPAVGFTANRPASFVCSLDGSTPAACASPYVPPAPLKDGKHVVTVTATDAAGRTGSASASFTIDTKAPTVNFAKKPKAVVKTRKGAVKETFRLNSSEKGSTLECKIDKGKFKPCKAKFTKSFKVGRHTVWAKATDAAGNVSKTATSKFKVERLKKHKKGH